MANTALYTHHSFARHEVPPGHAEHSGRYTHLEKSLTLPDLEGLAHFDCPLGRWEDIGLAHPDEYANAVNEASPQTGLVQLDADTFLGPNSLEATRRAVGGATDAVDRIIAGDINNAFIVARPPGHHAEMSRAMGFCLYNHVAIAALYAQTKHTIDRVAVVDFDVHHGNGTEAIFWHRENAFFASSHEWPQYPGTGRKSDRGAYDTIHNAPLTTGTDGEGFRRAWGETLLPALSDFKPDFVFISAGFDAHRADPLGGLALTAEDFHWITREISSIAHSSCNGRIVSILEGGYDLAALAQSARAHVDALMEA